MGGGGVEWEGKVRISGLASHSSALNRDLTSRRPGGHHSVLRVPV